MSKNFLADCSQLHSTARLIFRASEWFGKMDIWEIYSPQSTRHNYSLFQTMLLINWLRTIASPA